MSNATTRHDHREKTKYLVSSYTPKYHAAVFTAAREKESHLSDHYASLAFAQRPLLHDVVEELAPLHDLHHHVNLRVRLEDILHVDDVGMPQELQNLLGSGSVGFGARGADKYGDRGKIESTGGLTTVEEGGEGVGEEDPFIRCLPLVTRALFYTGSKPCAQKSKQQGRPAPNVLPLPARGYENAKRVHARVAQYRRSSHTPRFSTGTGGEKN